MCIEVRDERPSIPEVVIELPVHVSYPYLFEHGDSIYCVPETRQAKEIALYRAEDFPHGWSKIATLVSSFPGLDSTIFQYQGRWWLTSADGGSPSFNLFVWYAQNPLGPWNPHRLNPVKVDIRSSRPGGSPFMYGDHLYRPAQDCSKTYGWRIVINRITTLTPEEFEEERAAVVGPFANEPFPDGLHTLSAVGDITLIDGKRIVFSKGALKHTLQKAFSTIR